MRLPPKLCHWFLQLFLLLLGYITRSLSVTPEQFTSIFNIHIVTAVGGCGRKAPNNVFMLDYALESTSDAFDMASNVQLQIKTFRYNNRSSKKLRNLLFLFFGITFGEKNQIAAEKALDYLYVKGVFDHIVDILVKPKPLQAERPWLHCLEDYSFFTEHLIGSDGLENRTAPLAAREYNARLRNGSYYPGLMYSPRTSSYYRSSESNPRVGICAARDTITAFAIPGPVAGWGITLCPRHFTRPNMDHLPVDLPTNDPIELIRIFVRTGGMTMLHELAHLVSSGDIIDQPRVLPPGGVYTNRDWSLWTLTPNQNENTYGFPASQYLGLARPNLALLNADNYAIFALCLTNEEIECIGHFADAIAKRDSVPFQPAPEAVKQIQQGGSTLPGNWSGGV